VLRLLSLRYSQSGCLIVVVIVVVVIMVFIVGHLGIMGVLDGNLGGDSRDGLV